jgi:hypothetical protein
MEGWTKQGESTFNIQKRHVQPVEIVATLRPAAGLRVATISRPHTSCSWPLTEQEKDFLWCALSIRRHIFPYLVPLVNDRFQSSYES